jgi:hypothetical protein
MKFIKNILAFLLAIVFAVACNEGIDPISYVAPGRMNPAPVITVKYPVEGTKIQVPELVTSINIQLEVTDDIELKSISVLMDGTEIVSYNSFKDYRRAVEEYLYANVTNGAHTLTVKATDMEGKTTTVKVNFEKKPPYTPIFAGEVFYMPFDGDYVEKVSFQTATKVGTPGFAGQSLKGLNAYAGATDAYLTFPMANLKSAEFSAGFWYKMNTTPDRAGIISISPSGEDRTKGLRFFREGSSTSQRFKLNYGTGSGEVWNDGGVIDASNTDWVYLAFTISQSGCAIYINGALAASVPGGAINWTGCDNMSIASGAPNFAYWSHNSDKSYYDELRIFNKALSQSEIQDIIAYDSPYVPKYNGEVFYMPFEGNHKDLVSNTEAGVVGSPTYSDGLKGQAYTGATNSYLTFPITTLKSSEFSAAFWVKMNTTPDRAGIISISPSGRDRTKGLRFFREGSATQQRFKLNVGTGRAKYGTMGVL